MASKRIIEVRIKGSIRQSEKKQAEPKNDVNSVKEDKNLIENAVFTKAFKQVRKQLEEMAIYGINRHLQLTDDYITQRYLQAGVNIISKAISMGTTIMAGASVGGPVGAVVGAVVAVADLTFDIIKNYDQQNIMLRQMDAQLSYQRQRAGYSLTSGRIGENK